MKRRQGGWSKPCAENADVKNRKKSDRGAERVIAGIAKRSRLTITEQNISPSKHLGKGRKKRETNMSHVVAAWETQTWGGGEMGTKGANKKGSIVILYLTESSGQQGRREAFKQCDLEPRGYTIRNGSRYNKDE